MAREGLGQLLEERDQQAIVFDDFEVPSQCDMGFWYKLGALCNARAV